MQVNREQIPVSDRLDEVVRRKMEILRREQRIRRLRRAAIGMGTAAACFMGVVAVGVANPAWASQIPIIGHIFERMGENMYYPGDYSQKGSILESESEAQSQAGEEAGSEAEGAIVSAEPMDTAYTKTVDGVTVTLSEVYSNSQALNIALVLKSQEPFPDTFLNQDGKPQISLLMSEEYSYNPSLLHDNVYLDGQFLDEYTYAGVMRFDLNDTNTDDSQYVEAVEEAQAAGEETAELDYSILTKTVEIPETYSVKLKINQIVGELADRETRDIGVTQEELEAMPDEEYYAFRDALEEEDPSWYEYPNSHENYWFDGPWEFEIEVSQNAQDTVTVEVGVNENGLGVEKLVKTPYEITVYPLVSETEEEGASADTDYIPVILDADGMLMSTGSGGSANTVAIGDHDVSRVEVYLFEESKWLDEIKGYWWDSEEPKKEGTLEDGRTFKELCDETSVFHETVTIPVQ